MPTILRFTGLRVVIYPNDHRPEHVHVIGGGCEAVFELCCPDGPISLRESFGFTTQSLRRVLETLNAALLELCAAWEALHDSD